VAEIVLDDVSRRYGRRWALAHVGLTLRAGESWMLLGHNGSGKSTLIRCLASALRPHHGQIRFAGRDLWRDRAELREHIAVVGHHTCLYEDLSARENLAVWSRLAVRQTADLGSLLVRVGLDPSRRDPVRNFSAGMRRRVALARLLLKRPSLVLLDEPFTALDPAGRELLIGVIREIRAETGCTLVLATHLPQVAKAAAEHAAILDSGKLVFQGPVTDLPSNLAFE
jgi:heme exporter protein A